MTSTELAAPRQGEIWLTAFGAARIGEPGKTRPAVVLSKNGQYLGSIFDLVIVMPLSSSLRPSIAHPPVQATAATGLVKDSVIVVRAVRGLSRTRLQRRLGVVDEQTLADVQEILAALLDLPD